MAFFPRGQLRADDEGACQIAVAVQDGTLIIAFPKPVKWLGFGVADAEQLIGILQRNLEELKRTGG